MHIFHKWPKWSMATNTENGEYWTGWDLFYLSGAIIFGLGALLTAIFGIRLLII